MVKIENKEFQNPELTRLLGKNYAEGMISVLENEQQKGITVGEMRKRIKIMDKIEKVKTDSIIELEDEESNQISSIFEGKVYGAVSRELIEFGDALKGGK